MILAARLMGFMLLNSSMGRSGSGKRAWAHSAIGSGSECSQRLGVTRGSPESHRSEVITPP